MIINIIRTQGNTRKFYTSVGVVFLQVTKCQSKYFRQGKKRF